MLFCGIAEPSLCWSVPGFFISWSRIRLRHPAPACRQLFFSQKVGAGANTKFGSGSATLNVQYFVQCFIFVKKKLFGKIDRWRENKTYFK